MFSGTSLIWSPAVLGKTDRNEEVMTDHITGDNLTVEYKLGLRKDEGNGEMTILVR